MATTLRTSPIAAWNACNSVKVCWRDWNAARAPSAIAARATAGGSSLGPHLCIAVAQIFSNSTKSATFIFGAAFAVASVRSAHTI